MRYTKLQEEELRKRCKEVWPDAWFTMEGICGEGITSLLEDDNIAYLCYWYISETPHFRTCYSEIKRGMKRRPQALAYVLGERNDFND